MSTASTSHLVKFLLNGEEHITTVCVDYPSNHPEQSQVTYAIKEKVRDYMRKNGLQGEPIL